MDKVLRANLAVWPDYI